MGWTQWPYYPKNLSEAILPASDVLAGESQPRMSVVSRLLSGCSERLGRAFTVLEPVVQDDEWVYELSSESAINPQLKVTRIDAINPRQNFEHFCVRFRSPKNCDEACQAWDEQKARELFEIWKGRREVDCERYICPQVLTDFSCPVMVNNGVVAVAFSGQFLTPSAKFTELRKAAVHKASQLSGEPKLKMQKSFRGVRTPANEDDHFQFILSSQQRLSAGENPSDFTAILKQEAIELGRIIETEWKLRKREREELFLEELRRLFSAAPKSNSRKRVQDVTSIALQRAQDFLGVEYILLLSTPEARLSYEPNMNLLEHFCSVSVPHSVLRDFKHLNWRKAGFSVASENEQQPLSLSVPSCIEGNSELGRKIVESGLKCGNLRFFSRTSAICPVFISDNYRAVVMLGPFGKRAEILFRAEQQFLTEICNVIGTRVLNNLEVVDSAHTAQSWEDTAALLAHNARRGFTPVDSAAKIVNSYLEGNGIYTLEHAKLATKSLEAVHKQLGLQMRLPLTAFQAWAEGIYRFEKVHPMSIIHPCIELYRPVAKAKGVSIDINSSVTQLPEIEVDKDKLSIAIGHIIDNAIKYSDPYKRVTLRGSCTVNSVLFEVDDFGLGILPKDQKRIYEKGVQGDRSKWASDEPGEGLGLYHALMIIGAHGGELWHESHSGHRLPNSKRLDGYRTIFFVRLPIEQRSD